MDGRKRKVLQAIILDYIATADPVGSRTIAKKYDLGVSPATVRNEMSDLEEMGYLEQPHTSAGRIPSEAGYRYYVDCLMEKEPVDKAVRELIRNALLDRIKETDALIHLSTRLLSQFTKYTALVLAPFYGNNKLKHCQLLSVEPGKTVLVIVLDNGHVEHRLIETPAGFDERDCAAVSALLNEHLTGLTLDQWQPTILRAIFHDLYVQRKVLRQVMEQVEATLNMEYEQKVYLDGTLNIFNQPEFKHIDKVKALFELFQEERAIKEALQAEDSPGLSVRIGSENRHVGMKDCSLITATYHFNGKVIGTIGVLGPTRMEYSRAVSILEYLTAALNEGLSKL